MLYTYSIAWTFKILNHCLEQPPATATSGNTASSRETGSIAESPRTQAPVG